MITKEQLNEIGFTSVDNGTTYQDAYTFDYEFNIKTQELWATNDGFGDPEFLCRVTDIEQLKTLINYDPSEKDS